MKKQHTIINANDIQLALQGEAVEPMKKATKKTTTRKPAARKNPAHARAAEICKQLCFCFDVKPQPVYFKDVKSMSDLKESYKALAAIHHPDRGGDTATMAAINAEYDEKAKELAKSEAPAKYTTEKAEGMTDEEIAAAIAEEFKAALGAVMKLEGVTVELIGSWLWVSGDTKPVKEDLKSAGFRWCPKKEGQPWTWHDSYTIYISSKGRKTKEDIEDKYGKQTLKMA